MKTFLQTCLVASAAWAIAASAQSVIKALDQQLSCDPQPIEVRSNDGRLNLSAGALSGVRVGDRLLLVDQTKL